MQDTPTILSIGIDPFLIDFSSPEFAALPGLTAEKVAAGIDASISKLNELGYHADKCWIDFGETAISVVQGKIKNTQYSGILIGAGIRISPKNFILFEQLINVVHQNAPQAKIIFNTSPHDLIEAVQRWLP